jgi:hypothetical protein
VRFTFCAVVSRCAAVSLAPLLQRKVPSCLMPYVNGSHQQKRCGVLLSSYNDHLVCLKVSNISYTLPHLQFITPTLNPYSIPTFNPNPYFNPKPNP